MTAKKNTFLDRDQKAAEKESHHYDKTPIQFTAIFHGCKNDNLQMKHFDIFLFLLITHVT